MSESAVANKVETDCLALTEEQVDALADAWEAFLAAPQGKRTRSMLSAFDPFAAAVRQVAALPAEGLAFVVMTPPADGVEKAMLDSKGPIGFLSQRIRAVNPNAHLLLLPAGWSFRTMDRKQAREFAANMLAFVPDDDLEALGLAKPDAASCEREPARRIALIAAAVFTLHRPSCVLRFLFFEDFAFLFGVAAVGTLTALSRRLGGVLVST